MENAINISHLQLIQFAAILLAGLSAGLFYSYDCSVIKGLSLLPDTMYIQSFQSINKAIQNPYFFASFMGALLVLPLAAWMSYRHVGGVPFYLMLGAAFMYVVGVFGITVLGNVPLNEALAKFSVPAASAGEISAMRAAFEKPWNTYHTIRTIASVLSFSLAILSVIKNKP